MAVCNTVYMYYCATSGGSTKEQKDTKQNIKTGHKLDAYKSEMLAELG